LKQGTKGKRKETELRREMQICRTKEKNKTKINCCCALFPLLQVSVTLTAGVGRQKRKMAPVHRVCHLQRRRRVNPRAATVAAVQKAFPAIYGVFRGYFVNLKFCNVIFV
jgi:hypothetical protein